MLYLFLRLARAKEDYTRSIRAFIESRLCCARSHLHQELLAKRNHRRVAHSSLCGRGACVCFALWSRDTFNILLTIVREWFLRQVLDVVTSPYSNEFIELLLPLVDNPDITESLKIDEKHRCAEFIGQLQPIPSFKIPFVKPSKLTWKILGIYKGIFQEKRVSFFFCKFLTSLCTSFQLNVKRMEILYPDESGQVII